MTKSIYLLALMPLLVGTTIAAETAPLPIAVDPDQNGEITRNEFLNLRKGRAFAGDSNGDGLLSPSEFAPMIPSRVPRRMHGRAFSQFDMSADGYVDEAEMMAAPAQAFDQADKNKDNVISGSEIESFRTQLENTGLLEAQ
ncbi:MAG: hypothetical protein AAFR65_14505 [Pseudomonadota bacterium]